MYMLVGFKKVQVSQINGVASLTGFSYKKIYGRRPGPKNGGRINELTETAVPLQSNRTYRRLQDEIERFSFECRKTKTNQSNYSSQSQRTQTIQ